MWVVLPYIGWSKVKSGCPPLYMARTVGKDRMRTRAAHVADAECQGSTSGEQLLKDVANPTTSSQKSHEPPTETRWQFLAGRE